jgi:hypothetical protein
MSDNIGDSNKPPTYADVVRLIRADGKDCQLLSVKIEKCASMIIAARRDEDRQPTYKHTRDCADEVIGAARLLLDLFAGENKDDAAYPKLPFLIHMYNGDPHSGGVLSLRGQTEFVADLRDVIVRAQSVKTRFSGKAGGPGKAWTTSGALSARELCAVIIIEAWNVSRGNLPSPSNAEVWQAADLLWLASGGPPLNKSGETVDAYERWFRPMKTAKASNDPNRRWIRGKLQPG